MFIYEAVMVVIGGILIVIYAFAILFCMFPAARCFFCFKTRRVVTDRQSAI